MAIWIFLNHLIVCEQKQTLVLKYYVWFDICVYAKIEYINKCVELYVLNDQNKCQK